MKLFAKATLSLLNSLMGRVRFHQLDGLYLDASTWQSLVWVDSVTHRRELKMKEIFKGTGAEVSRYMPCSPRDQD